MKRSITTSQKAIKKRELKKRENEEKLKNIGKRRRKETNFLPRKTRRT